MTLLDVSTRRCGLFPYGTSPFSCTLSCVHFAESYTLYLAGGRSDGTMLARYAHRWAILDKLFASA